MNFEDIRQFEMFLGSRVLILGNKKRGNDVFSKKSELLIGAEFA